MDSNPIQIERLLIANRGEIALRIIRTCKTLGIKTTLAASTADLTSLPACEADQVLCIGPPPAASSYLSIDALLMAARMAGCDAVHPGYGFLAEAAEFSRRCQEAGLTFVGPRPELLELLGNKVTARESAIACGLPVLQGSAEITTALEAATAAEALGYPVLLKPSRGGGGKGMRVVNDPDELQNVLQTARNETSAAFGDGGLFLEKWIARARHVEIQVAGDKVGNVIHLGDRDCSVQRRHQKLIEEAPAPHLPPATQDAIRAAAVDLCRGIAYDSVGTVEFLVDAETHGYYFLEVNPRIQVEHGVTELVTGIDLIELQLRIASGADLSVSQDEIVLHGNAIECRINAESPSDDFRPSPGTVTTWEVPTGANVRVDTFIKQGAVVPPFYDSLIAKVMTRGDDRETAISALESALQHLEVGGISTTQELGAWIVNSDDFRHMRVHTRWLDEVLSQYLTRDEAVEPAPPRQELRQP